MSDRIVTRAISPYVSWQGPEDAWQAFLDEDVQRNKFKHGGIAANTHQYAPCRTQPVGYDPVHSHERITENTKHVSLTSSPPEISFQDTTHAYECGYRDGGRAAGQASIAAIALPSQQAQPFQDRVQPWLHECFGAEIAGDRLEWSDRLLEEVFELLQAGNYPRERIAALSSYVWSRPIGEPAQEVGGVMVTLAAYCLAHGLDMHGAGDAELARVWTKVEKIRAKQAAKPVGSALPQAWPSQQAQGVQVKPLVWKALYANYDGGKEHFGTGIFGHWYGVKREKNGSWRVAHHVGSQLVEVGYFPSLEAAKSAARADYEARILAALEGGDA